MNEWEEVFLGTEVKKTGEYRDLRTRRERGQA